MLSDMRVSKRFVSVGFHRVARVRNVGKKQQMAARMPFGEPVLFDLDRYDIKNLCLAPLEQTTKRGEHLPINKCHQRHE